MTLLTHSDLEDFKNICEEFGYKFNDFSLKESHIKEEVRGEAGKVLTGEVIVTCKGISKTYLTGFERNWVGRFSEDLKSGVFK